MTNLFEDEDAHFLVLVNDENQHSLWPVPVDVPDGWSVARPEDTRQACLDYIEDAWVDMRPRSLADAMDAGK